MKLLPLDNPRWNKYRTGYNRVETNITDWIKILLKGNFAESHWDFLWDELHHQNDVGEASYAVVPYLAQYAIENNKSDWHIFGFPAVVELARLDTQNPDIPSEIKESYFNAFDELSKFAVNNLERWSDIQTPCIAACIALAKGQRTFARTYLEMSSKDTAAEFLRNEIGWEPGENDL